MPTLLFADDMEEVRKPLCALLEQRGYTVLEAADGDEALSLARSHSSRIDLLITDIVMPGLGGPELRRAMKGVHPEARVLFISGYPMVSLDESAAFLQKPFKPNVLLDRVAELVAKGAAAEAEPASVRR